MSDSGNSNNRSGYDNRPDLLSDIEQDCQPLPETQRSHGNFSSTHSSNIGDHYSQRHPLVTGHSTFNDPHVQIFRKSNYDIVPEISSIYDGYKSEEKRLETFYDWPSNAPVTKEDLARNGFIYMHVSDRAQCIFCRGVLSSWDVGDVVENEHKRHCPECPFAFGYECGNIPLQGSSQITVTRLNANSNTQPKFYLQSSNSKTQSYNTTVHIPVQSPHRQVNGEITPSVATLNRPDSRPSGLSSLGSLGSLPSLPAGQSVTPQTRTVDITTNEPKYREWGDEYKRVRSFKGWPIQMNQKPLDLANAGLLYMGTDDRCKCFWCGGELYDWEPQDTPWEEHAKWFPHCGYVRGVKGDAYIQNIRARQNGLILPPPVQEQMRSPHVLSLLAEGYTQEQVEEVFNIFGRDKLIDARSIKEAIEKTRRQRQAMRERTAGTQETGSPVTLPSEHEEMEVEETPENKVVQKVEEKKKSKDSSPESSSASSSKDKDVETVMQENEKLKDMKLCKICMDNELCMTFLPCGHLATCEDCAKTLLTCPVCRRGIDKKVKIFWA